MVNDYASLKFQTVELVNNQDIPNLPTVKLEWLAYIAIFSLFQCSVLRIKVSFYESLLCKS